MKITSLLCQILSVFLWVVGAVLCIKGAFMQGIPIILMAILASPSWLQKSKKIKKALILAKNICVLFIAVFTAFTLHINNIPIHTVISSIFAPQTSLTQDKTAAGNTNNTSTQAGNNNQEEKLTNSSVGASSSLPDIALPSFDPSFIQDAIIENGKEGSKILHEIANKDPNPYNNNANPNISGNTHPTNATPNSTSVTSGKLEIHFLDVGQGDCSLIICDNEALLIDTGPDGNGTKIQNYLNKIGVNNLSALILTHPDADHIGSADVIITKFDIGNVFMPNYTKNTATYRDTIEAISAKGYNASMPAINSTFTLGTSTLTFLAPLKEYEDVNNNSIVFILEHGNNKILFTGDAEQEAEEDMLANNTVLKADVLKVGHHGSKTSSTEAFIKEVAPAYAVISCAAGNDYYHPHTSALNTLRTAGTQVFRTDEQGTIILYSDAETISFNCSPSDSWKAGG